MSRKTKETRKRRGGRGLIAPSSSTTTLLSTFLFLLLLVTCKIAQCDKELKIHDVNDFVTFSNNVNSGTTYKGTTILLDDDIDFTEELSSHYEPIIYFQGTFNGQGHVIRNFVLNSSSQFAGLFGYSTGTNIKNIVIDETCSITNKFSSGEYQAFAGGIIGYCKTNEGACIIENNVNMASIEFSGNMDDTSFTGGIIGALVFISYKASIKNCANYGSVSNTGTSSGAYTGGIAGSSQKGSSATVSSYVYVQNCFNSGTIFSDGMTSVVIIGGISGHGYYSMTENCVNTGNIVTANSGKKIIGSVVGYIDYSPISHCYWDASIGYIVSGVNSYLTTESHSFNSASFELEQAVSAGNYTGKSLVDALNGAADHYTLRGYSHWILNIDEKNVSFTVNNTKRSFSINSQVILLPDFVDKEGLFFDGWYTDTSYSSLLTNYVIEEEGEDNADLYGRWEVNANKYTISFDTRGGAFVSSVTYPFGTTVSLPTSITKKYCKFQSWETEYGDDVPTSDFVVPDHNITLYAVWLCTRITTTEDLVAFSKIVNYHGASYKGSTVSLYNDIDFTEELSNRFELIGKNYINYFRGTFNGQGHVIRNLTLNASNRYTGLFGYSTGATIKSIVLDETCSVVNSYESNIHNIYTGGIIGYCDTDEGACNIENNVNMANVTFRGNAGGSTPVGGIIGMLYLSNNKAILKNCANYGTVSNAGTSSSYEYAYVGGIIGSPQGSSNAYNVSVQNCINYGTVIFNGTAGVVTIGGISGFIQNSSVVNCVSSGSVFVFSGGKKKFVGIIVGYSEFSSISNCYWTSDVGRYEPVGDSPNSAITSISYSEQLNTTTLNSLNNYATKNRLSKWFMLHLNGGEINGLNQSELVVLQNHFPSPLKENNTFVHWCKGFECDEIYDYGTSDVADLYAAWEIGYVTFLFDNRTIAGPVSTKYGEKYGPFPEIDRKKEGYIYCWFTSKEGGRRVTSCTNITFSSNHTLYGRWAKNNYIATFILGNGTSTKETLQYDEIIRKPKNIEREGHTFIGWNNSVFQTMPAKNITITALWVKNNYTVTFDLGNGTSIKEAFQYNETIKLPINIEKERCTFNGWNNSGIQTMPAENITFIPLLDCFFPSSSSSSSSSSFSFSSSSSLSSNEMKNGDNVKSKSSSNTGAIVGGVVGVIVLIIIIVFIVLFLILFKRRNNGDGKKSTKIIEMNEKNSRIVEKSMYVTSADDIVPDTISDCIIKFYPENYEAPTIAEALRKSGIDNDKIDYVVDACSIVGSHVVKNGGLFEGFTKNNAEALALYTFDFGKDDYDSNPYRIINSSLVTKNEKELLKASGLLFLVMSALRKLPKYAGVTLYRGVRSGVDLNMYKRGKVVVWHSLSSTSPDMGATKAFLAKNSEDGNAEGTLFVIEEGWGYDIQPYSLFPDEAEILLEPERQFRVEDVIEANLTVIKLKMLDTPLVLPEVFGNKD